MKSKYLQVFLAGVILFFHSCDGCRNLPKSQLADFDITCEVKEENVVYTEAQKRVKLNINIKPNNTVAKNVPYYQVLDWDVVGNVTGELTNAEGEKVTSDTKLQNGENILFYDPKELGEHTVTIQVTDKYQDLKKEGVFPSIIVQDKPTPFFKASLKAVSTNIFNHQSTPIELEITSDDPKAKELSYTIKSVENVQGALHFENGKEVKPNSGIILGSQKLIFKPIAQIGRAKIKIRVSNGISDSTASLNLEIKPLSFTIDLKGPSKHIFTYQTTPIDLTITSKEEGTSGLTYQIKTIEVLKGELQFVGTGKKVGPNDSIKYGTQHLVFRPNGETGQARVQITVVNTETKTEANGSVAWELKPLNFKANAWLTEPKKEEEKQLIQGDFAVLEVLLSGIDKNLAKEEWKIIGWQFSDGIQRNIVDKELKQLSEFPLSTKNKNTLYLHLPSIRLDQDPTMTLKVEGPGKSNQEDIIQLGPIQKAIIRDKIEACITATKQLIQKIDDCLRLPVNGVSYVKAKDLSQKVKTHMAMVEEEVNEDMKAAFAGLKITQTFDALRKKKSELDSFKQECENKKSAFKAQMSIASRSLFAHQTAIIALNIHAGEEEARSLIYKIGKIEVINGTFHDQNGEEVKVGTILSYGDQNLIFKPTGQPGEAKVILTVENNKAGKANTGLVLEIKPVNFQVDAQVREPIREEEDLVQGDFAVLEVKLFNINKELFDEEWKITEWSFNDTIIPIHTAIPSQEVAFALIKNSRMKQIQQSIDTLSNRVNTKEVELKVVEKELEEAQQEFQEIKGGKGNAVKRRLEQLLRKTEEKAKKYAEKLQESEKKVEEAEEDLKTVESDSQESNNELQSAKKGLKAAAEAVEDANNKLKSTQNRLKQSKTEYYKKSQTKAEENYKNSRAKLEKEYKKDVVKIAAQQERDISNLTKRYRRDTSNADRTCKRRVARSGRKLKKVNDESYFYPDIRAEAKRNHETTKAKAEEEYKIEKEKANRKLELATEKVKEEHRANKSKIVENYNNSKAKLEEDSKSFKVKKETEKELKGAEEELNLSEVDLEKAKEEIEAAKEKLQAAEEKVEEAKGELEGVEEEVENAKKDVKEVKEKLKEAEGKLSTVKEKVRRAKTRLDRADKCVYETDAEDEEAVREAKEAKEAKEDVEEELEKGEEEVEEAKEDVEEAKEELKEAEAKVKEANREIEKAEQALKESKEDLKVVELNLEEARGKIKLAAELENAEKGLGQAKEQLEEAKERLQQAEEQVKEYEEKLQESEEQLEGAKEQLKGNKEALEEAAEEVEEVKKEIRLSNINKDKQEEFLKEIEENVRRISDNLKIKEELFRAQKQKVQAKIQRLENELEIEKKLQATQHTIQASRPVLLSKELDELKIFSLSIKDRNKFYLKLPNIRLDKQTALVLHVEGPGHTTKSIDIQLSDVQRSIINRKMDKFLETITTLSKQIDDCKKLPISGNNYSRIKSFIKEADPRFRAVSQNIEASCGPKWLESPVISLSTTQSIIREMPSIEKSRIKLKELQKACKEKGVSFKAELQVDDRNLLNNQIKQVILELSSSEKGAKSLDYIIKEIEVKNGELFFDNGSKVSYGNKVEFGKQNLTFKTSGVIGDATIKITVSNGKGGESSTMLVLEVRTVIFKAELQVDARNIFNYQTKQLTLGISSSEKEAENLDYIIKEIEVKNGELFFDNGSQVGNGSKLKYGKQNLTFKPTIKSGNANIYIRVVNGKGTDSTTGLVLEILPVKFRVDAWLKEPKEEERRLMKGDFTILEIMFSDVDDQLANGPWKLVGWNFSSDPARASMSGLASSTEFKNFANVLQDLNLSLIEGGSEKKIQKAIAVLKDKQEAEGRRLSYANQYISAVQEKFEAGQKYIEHIDKELKKIPSSYELSMALVTLHETRRIERSYQEGKQKLSLEVQQLSRQIELQRQKVTRDQQLKLIQDKKIDEKIERLVLALEVRRKLKEAQGLSPNRLVQPRLLDTELKQLAAYPLKVMESNKFYLSLPNLCIAPTMTFKVEGPGDTIKEVVVKLAPVLQPIAEKKLESALEVIKSFSNEIDGYLGMSVTGSNYDKLREFIRKKEPKFKETFKDIETAYGREWWKNPVIMSLENLEYIVDEMVILEKKKDKLDALKKACKQKKFTFNVNAVLKQPEGEKIMVMDYAVLKIKLLDVDESLANESWKLLDWQYSDNFPRGIVDKDLQELTEFPLSVKAENELYLRLPKLEITSNPTLTLQIGVTDKTIQEVVIELGPIQRALGGKEMSKFLETIQNLNREIDDYLNLFPKERLYDKLINIKSEADAKIRFYNGIYETAQKALKGNPKVLAKLLPGATGRDLEWIIEKGIPALETNLKRLKAEEKAWGSVIDEVVYDLSHQGFNSLRGNSKEQIISSIYNADKKGRLLIHKLLEEKVTVTSEASKFIIERTPDINTRNEQGYTALHLAVKNRDLFKVKMLLKNGASQGYGAPSPDGTGSGYTPMHYVVASAASNSYAIMRALMDNWRHTNYDNPSNEADQFLMSVIRADDLSEYEKTERIKLLLQCEVYADRTMEEGGYSLYFEDNRGWTPLYAAIERGYVEICSLILKNISQRGSSPSHGNVTFTDGLYYNVYPYWVCYYSVEHYTVIGKAAAIIDVLSAYNFDSSRRLKKSYYEFNPFK